jgi:hypothetical protein
MALTKAQLEALKNSLLASQQPIIASKHRELIQNVINEMYDAQSRGNLLAGVQQNGTTTTGDTLLLIRSGQIFLVPTSLFGGVGTLTGLSDVVIIDEEGDEVLMYKAVDGVWKNVSLDDILGRQNFQAVTERGFTTTVPSLNIGQSAGASDVNLNLGQARTADGNSFIDFHSASGGADFDFRIIKFSGAGALAEIRNVAGPIQIITQTESNINFATSGVSRLIIHAGTGNVSIGSPTDVGAKLFVNGNIRMDGTDFLSSAIHIRFLTPAGSALPISTNNLLVSNNYAHRSRVPTNGMYVLGDILTDGRIGVGTLTPVSFLHVKTPAPYGYINSDNNSNTGGGIFVSSQNGAQKASFGVSGYIAEDTSSDAFIGAGNENGIRFYRGTVETARINSAGRLGINSVNPLALIHVISPQTDFTSRFENLSSNPFGISVTYNSSPNSQFNQPFWFRDSGLVRFEVRSNGGIANFSANNVNLSDKRVKKEIKKASSVWRQIKEIEVVDFKYKDQTHDDFNLGVIAQQVLSVAPRFVDVDGFGKTPKNSIPLMSVYDTDLQYAALKALQEAMNRIERLENQTKE